MQIPKGSSGFPTVSATQLRAYGAGGFRLDAQELPRGCPRQYKAKYVERRVPERRSDVLQYGSFVHDALYLMEQDGLTPDEALEKAFPVGLDPSFWAEAQADMTEYLARGAAPMDRFMTVAVELDIQHELFVDEEFGPVYYRSIIDWLGVDPEYPSVVHVVDYKTNRQPPSESDVRGDVQLKGYHWAGRQYAIEVLGISDPVIVVHLDAVKWREVEVRFSETDIESWHSWAVAVTRQILRDEEALPVLTPDCAWCPVRNDCPEYDSLPDKARAMSALLSDEMSPEQRLRWRNAANSMRLLLEKAVKGVDAAIEEEVARTGYVAIGDTEWVREPSWKDVWDLQSLHRVMGPAFYQVASVSKTAITEATAEWDPSNRAAALACRRSTPVGTKTTRRKKVDDDG